MGLPPPLTPEQLAELFTGLPTAWTGDGCLRARTQNAAGERLHAKMIAAGIPIELWLVVDAMGYIHPDGRMAWEPLGARYEQVLEAIVAFLGGDPRWSGQQGAP
jgi:hypothetical protein